MNRTKRLASNAAVAVAVLALLTPSAFADFRHSHETRGRDSGHSSERHDRGRTETRTFDRGRSNQTFRNDSRNDARTFRNDSRNDSRTFRNDSRNDSRTFRNDSRNDSRTFRNDSRNDSRSFRNDSRTFHNESRNFDRGRSFDHGRSFDRGRPFFHEGRVSRFERFGGGFRVWLVGAPYPFFIPEARFRLFPHFGVGLSIRLGGYYNPLGYYDYYDGAYDPYYAAPAPVYPSGELRGIVESVDYRRGTALIHDSVSNSFVTIEMRGGDRRFDDLHIGDYVELSGDWTRVGVFEAYRVDALDPAGYRYR